MSINWAEFSPADEFAGHDAGGSVDWSKFAPADGAPAEPEGGFINAAIGSVGPTISGIGRGLSDLGATGIGEAVRGYGDEISQAHPQSVTGFAEAAQHPWQFVKESVGQMVGQALAGGAAGAAIGGGVGALTGPLAPVAAPALSALGGYIGANLPTTAGEYEGIRQKQEQGGTTDLPAAMGGALTNTAIENFGGFAPSSLAKPGKLLAKGADALAGKTIKEAAKLIGKEMIKSGAQESGEELLQNPIGDIAAHQNPAAPENVASTLFGAASAFPGGALFGGGRMGVSAAKNYFAESPQQAPEDMEKSSQTFPVSPIGQASSSEQPAGPMARAAAAAPIDLMNPGNPAQNAAGVPVGEQSNERQQTQESATHADAGQGQEGLLNRAAVAGVAPVAAHGDPNSATAALASIGVSVPPSKINRTHATTDTTTQAPHNLMGQQSDITGTIHGASQNAAAQERQDQAAQTVEFKPTHITQDGLPVMASAAPGVWVDRVGQPHQGQIVIKMGEKQAEKAAAMQPAQPAPAGHEAGTLQASDVPAMQAASAHWETLNPFDRAQLAQQAGLPVRGAIPPQQWAKLPAEAQAKIANHLAQQQTAGASHVSNQPGAAVQAVRAELPTQAAALPAAPGVQNAPLANQARKPTAGTVVQQENVPGKTAAGDRPVAPAYTRSAPDKNNRVTFAGLEAYGGYKAVSDALRKAGVVPGVHRQDGALVVHKSRADQVARVLDTLSPVMGEKVEGAAAPPSVERQSVKAETEVNKKINNVIKNWDVSNRARRSDEWTVGELESNKAFNAVGNDGIAIPSHGMAKAATLMGAYNALNGLIQDGPDHSRDFFTAGLTARPGIGAATGTAGGHSYRDGAFIIVFRQWPNGYGANGKFTKEDIVGVLVNPAHAELAPLLQAKFQNIVVRDYHDVQDVVNAAKERLTDDGKAAVVHGQADNGGSITQRNYANNPTLTHATTEIDTHVFKDIVPASVQNEGQRGNDALAAHAKQSDAVAGVLSGIAPNAAAQTEKQPWEMTRAEYEQLHGKPRKNTTVTRGFSHHKNAVATAINQGKPVPAEVLADYPDLQANSPTTNNSQPDIKLVVGGEQDNGSADQPSSRRHGNGQAEPVENPPEPEHVSGGASKKGGKVGASKEKIEDFGEKIGGARKDKFQAYKDKMEQAKQEDVLAAPLSKTWPEPDYQSLLDEGADSWAVAFAHAARDEVPRKPVKTWQQKQWAAQVEALRDTSHDLMTGALSPMRARQLLQERSDMSRAVSDIIDRVELYQLVGHAQSLKGVGVSRGEYSLYEGVEYNPSVIIWTVDKEAKATALSSWPRQLASGATRKEALQKFKAAYESLTIQKPASREVQFDIYSKRGEKGVFIGKKIGRNYFDLAKVDTVKEARTYKAEHQAELVVKLEKIKEIPQLRRDTNNPRVGEDMRAGQDVTPAMFGDAFGFRGVEFGNYVENAKRQADLNDAYDALMDMAAVLDVSPKALSLNGELGIAFGARGSGGIDAAKAHYEPGFVVINLTKKSGAGSLGHEWWHALDNYFSRMRGKKSDYMTDAMDVSLVSRDSDYMHRGEVRKEMIRAFGMVMKAIRQSELKKRSAVLDGRRSKDYYSTNVEMSARSFETYLIAKLQDQNASNDYLANIVDENAWTAAEKLRWELEGSYPYPNAKEIPSVRAAFDQFFDTVQTKEPEKGMALYSRGAHQDDSTQPLTVRDVKAAVNSVVVDHKNLPEIRIFNSPEDLRTLSDGKALYRDMEANGALGDVDGLSSNGVVWMFAERFHSPERAIVVLQHELLHYGLAGRYGRQLDAILMSAYRSNPKLREQANEIARKYGYSRLVATEEALAVMAERGEHPTLWQRVVAAIRNMARRMGFRLDMNDADVLHLTTSALRYAKEKPKGGFGYLYRGGTRFSQNATDDLPALADSIAKAKIPRRVPLGIAQEIASWSFVSKSPYSDSFYSMPGKSWDATPQGIKRVSDHWNFYSQGETHAKTDVPVPADMWALGEYHDGVYRVLMTAPQEGIERLQRGKNAAKQAGQQRLQIIKDAQDRIAKAYPRRTIVDIPLYWTLAENKSAVKRAKSLMTENEVRQFTRLEQEELLANREIGAYQRSFDNAYWSPEELKGGMRGRAGLSPEGQTVVESTSAAPKYGHPSRARQSIDETPDIRYSRRDTAEAAMGSMFNAAKQAVNDKELPSSLASLAGHAKRLSMTIMAPRTLADLAEKILPMMRHSLIPNREAMEEARDAYKERYAQDVMLPYETLLRDNPAEADRVRELLMDSTKTGVDASEASYAALFDIAAGKDRTRVLRDLMRGRAGDAKGKFMREVKEIKMRGVFEQGREQAFPELKGRYAALTDQGKDLYKRVVQWGSYSGDAYFGAMEAQINDLKISRKAKQSRLAALKQVRESLRVSGPYVPMQRFGDFWVSSKAPDEAEASFDMFDNLEDQQRFIRQRKAEGATIHADGVNIKQAPSKGVVSLSFVGDVDKMLEDLGDGPEIEAMRDKLYQMYLERLPSISASKHFIHRKKTPGYSAELFRALSFKAMHDANSISRIRYNHKLNQALEDGERALATAASKARLDDLREEIDNLKFYAEHDLGNASDAVTRDVISQERNLAYSELGELPKLFEGWRRFMNDSKSIQAEIARLETILQSAEEIGKEPRLKEFARNTIDSLVDAKEDWTNPKVQPWAILANQFGFAAHLAASPAAGIVNALQPVISMAVVGSRYGAVKTEQAFKKAYGEYFKDAAGKMKRGETVTIRDSLKGEELRAFDAVHSGIDRTLAFDVSEAGEASVMAAPLRRRINHAMGWFFQQAERLNREVTFIAAFRMAREGGNGVAPLGHAIAMQYAKDIMYQTHGDYSQSNRAKIMRGNTARVLTQFKAFTLMMTMLMGSSWNSAFHGATAQEKAEGRKVLAGIYGMQLLFTGALGWPSSGILMGASLQSLAQGYVGRATSQAVAGGLLAAASMGLFGDDDEPWDWEADFQQFLAETFGKDAGNAIARGVIPGAIKAAGLPAPDLTARMGMQDLWFREPDKELEGEALGNYVLQQMLGPAAGSFIGLTKALKLMHDEHYERGIEALLPKVGTDLMRGLRYGAEGEVRNLRGDAIVKDVGWDEAILKMMGFNPERVSEQYAQNNANMAADTFLKARKQWYLDRYADAVRDGDNKDKTDIRARIQAWNAKNPAYRITGETIASSLRARARRSASMQNGVPLSKAFQRSGEGYNF